MTHPISSETTPLRCAGLLRDYWRKEACCYQQDFASDLGLTPQDLSRYTSSRTPVPLDILEKVRDLRKSKGFLPLWTDAELVEWTESDEQLYRKYRRAARVRTRMRGRKRVRRREETRRSIQDLILQSLESISLDEIMISTRWSFKTVDRYVRILEKEGIVRRVRKGNRSYVEAVRAPSPVPPPVPTSGSEESLPKEAKTPLPEGPASPPVNKVEIRVSGPFGEIALRTAKTPTEIFAFLVG